VAWRARGEDNFSYLRKIASLMNKRWERDGEKKSQEGKGKLEGRKELGEGEDKKRKARKGGQEKVGGKGLAEKGLRERVWGKRYARKPDWKVCVRKSRREKYLSISFLARNVPSYWIDYLILNITNGVTSTSWININR
jgi:hypothetical protein